jgi:hypothetical protein
LRFRPLLSIDPSRRTNYAPNIRFSIHWSG